MDSGTQAARIGWADGSIDLRIDVSADGTVTLDRFAAGLEPGSSAAEPGGRAGGPGPHGLPLCDIILAVRPAMVREPLRGVGGRAAAPLPGAPGAG